MTLGSRKGAVGGVNTNLSADGILGSSLRGNSWSTAGAGRLEAYYSGKLVRLNLTDFSPTGVQVMHKLQVSGVKKQIS